MTKSERIWKLALWILALGVFNAFVGLINSMTPPGIKEFVFIPQVIIVLVQFVLLLNIRKIYHAPSPVKEHGLHIDSNEEGRWLPPPMLESGKSFQRPPWNFVMIKDKDEFPHALFTNEKDAKAYLHMLNAN